MGFLARLGEAANIVKRRSKIGGSQGALMLYLNKVHEMPKKVDQLLTEMTTEAWKIERISKYFQSLGFSFEDYDAMFRAAFFTCPQARIEPNLAVTVLMIDECNKIDIFKGIAKAIANEANRKEAAARLVADWVQKAVNASPNKPSHASS